MIAATIDLLLVLAAWLTVLAVWQGRRRIEPVQVWEKLMVGSALVGAALLVRFTDALWLRIPWPPLADPLVQQATVIIGLIGGALAVVAGIAEWVPVLVGRGVTGRWREYWSAEHAMLEHMLNRADNAERTSIALVSFFQRLCETPHVYYCAFRQRQGEFVRLDAPTRPLTADWLQALDRVAGGRNPTVMRTEDGWLLAIPVAMGSRIYGAVMVQRSSDHIAFGETSLLAQSAQRAAFALARIVHEAQSLRVGRLARFEARLESTLGTTEDPITDLMSMLDLLHGELDMEYAACLAYEGEGAYARRYSRLWEDSSYSERGLQVAIGHAVLPQQAEGEAMVASAGGPVLSPAVVPHDHLTHRASVTLYRGTQSIGVLVVASHCKRLELSVDDFLHRVARSFATALERIGARSDRNMLARRVHALGKLAGQPDGTDRAHDYLTARILDEIPGTFCQYMRVAPDSRTLHVEYRRSRRGGWGRDTTGRRFELSLLPTCRMVMESGRTVLFRQDDPERQFDPQEAEALFGAIPSSMLMIPVIMGGTCCAMLAVGEMRETRRHSYNTDDRRFADGLARLHAADAGNDRAHRSGEPLRSLGDLNLTFASPLTGILGSVEILRQGTSDDGLQGKYLDVIERNAARIRDTVSDLADLTFPAERARKQTV